MSKIKKIVLSIISTIVIIIVGLIVYDRVTINNMYYISEKNLEIPIFVYHNIVKSKSDIEYDYMQTDVDTYENQIKGLQKVGYHFINYNDLQEYKDGKKKIYKKSCIITFDDGYEGVYENAYPISKKYNIPITMYLIIDNMEQTGVIKWEEAKEMSESGLVTIASHSMDHPQFTTLTTNEAVENVNNSYAAIEEHIGKQEMKIFTYPYGLYTEEQINELSKLGYIQNLTDNKINKSKDLHMDRLHRCYPLNDSTIKMIAKIAYRSIRYN